MAVRFEVHPAIGIARVGNSDDHFVFDGPSSWNGPRRDGVGRLLRQAVEFRIYACDRDANGRIASAREITADQATIQWAVHIANRKAVAPRFASAGRRNNSTGDDQSDRALIIDAGRQSVSTTTPSRLLSGQFQTKTVELGSIHMQANGRLRFVGGDGSAGSPTNQPVGENGNFADNEGWFDTISDGVVQATVTQNGTESTALAAWVIVAPPDYAPPITNLVTMYDVVFDTAIHRGVLAPPSTVVFKRDVRPLLERAMGYQWVNQAARLGFDGTSGGHSSGGIGDFSLQMDQLGDPTVANAARARIFGFLRDPQGTTPSQAPINRRMPRLNDDNNTGNVFTFTGTQYDVLRRWSHGEFVNDAQEQDESEPDRLTSMALETCAGGPFFPGIEAGRIMRDASIYVANEAFRISPDRVKPGGITQNNAVPWQADFHLCRWEERENGALKRLGWWPAQRPDDVLKSKDADPVSWSRGLADAAIAWVKNWHRLGFVKEDPANPGVFVEVERDTNLAEDALVA